MYLYQKVNQKEMVLLNIFMKINIEFSMQMDKFMRDRLKIPKGMDME